MKYTILQFQQQFPNDDACLDFIFKSKYSHIEGFNKYYRVRGRKCYAHSETGHQIHPTAGTVFHKSPTKLSLWFFAIFLFSASKNGVSAKELERQLGVTYKCAYRIGQQIRKLMVNNTNPFGGTVEVDETYIGGKGGNNKRGRGAENKTPVVGIVERQGNIIAEKVENVKSSTVAPLIRKNVVIGANLMTDEYRIYTKVGHEYNHQVINHGQRQYVNGNIHTNTIEGFWSQLKNSITGTHHFVSPKHLQSYLNEFVWKYNHRTSLTPIFHEIMRLV